jgi:hypothetical protein
MPHERQHEYNKHEVRNYHGSESKRLCLPLDCVEEEADHEPHKLQHQPLSKRKTRMSALGTLSA